MTALARGGTRSSNLRPFTVGVYGEWGEGTIGRIEGDQLTVVFDSVGYKTLDAGLVAERGLLTRE